MTSSSGGLFLPSPAQTQAAGLLLGQSLERLRAEGAVKFPFLILLRGDLGAGKTSLTKSLAKALADVAEEQVLSPTFSLANEYAGRLEIFHLDLYRLPDEEEFFGAGLDEYLRRPGLTVIEWPEKMPENFWPPQRLELRLLVEGEGRRLYLDFAPPAVYNDLIESLATVERISDAGA